jgi:hypothetical protein
MTARLKKELRPLLFPWIITAIAAVTYTDQRAFAIFSWLWLTFGCLALACIPFGSEFENRTFGLFLSQPRARGRLWWDKFLAAGIALVTLPVVRAFTEWLFAPGSAFDRTLDLNLVLPFTAVFAITTLCSAGFLTLISGTTIGGVVLTLILQVFPYLVVDLLLPRAEPWMLKSAAMGYSVLMLWAGWRKFSRLELRDAPATSSASLPEAWVPGLTSLLRCRPHGVWFNLIRKELLLLRLLAHASLLFTAVWLVLIGLSFLAPQKADTLEIWFYSIYAVFSAAVLLLAGSLSASEDRTLGTSAWQLTLPVPARRQWLIKLLTGAGTAFCLGYLLPQALAGITPSVLSGMRDGNLDFSIFSITVGLIFFTMGFWFASFGENVVRAAISALVVLGAGGPLAAWAWFTFKSAGYQWDMLIRVLSYFQLPPDFIQSSSAFLPFLIVTLPVLLVALLQSRRQFSGATVRAGVRHRYGTLLILFAVSMMFWVSDLRASQQVAEQRFRKELFVALRATPFAPALRAGLTAPLTVTSEELEQTGILSVSTREWIRNSRVVIWPGGTTSFWPGSSRGRESWENVNPGPVPLSIRMTFPNGRIYDLI